MIYFIQDTKSRAIKIGVSSDPVARLKQLQTAHSSELKTIAVMDGGRAEEQALHQLFTRKRGEWFEPTRDLLAYIKENAVSVSSSSAPRRRKSVMDDWHPDLQKDSYLVSTSRVVHYIIEKGTGTLDEVVGIVHMGYQNLHNQCPSEYPPMSLDDVRAELQRLVSIQDDYQLKDVRPL